MRTQEESNTREFYFSDANFGFVQKLAYDTTGINLSDHKRNMVYGRLARRIRKLGLNSFDDYCSILKDSRHPEFPEFINSITTNLTSFFRESYHFEFLKKTVLKEAMVNNRATKRIRGWSAGCSTGEEPYSIAITATEALPVKDWDFKLLATDLDSNVVSTARAGIYASDRIESLDKDIKSKYFRKTKDGQSVSVKPGLQELITFNQLNLLNDWPMKGPFDFIFCRNVVIYFDKETQRKLFDRYANILKPNGYLFIGHSENLHRVCDRFKSLGKTTYQRLK